MWKLGFLLTVFACLDYAKANICDDGWTYYCDPRECYCYNFINRSMTWPEAHSLCKNQNSSLVSYHSDEERQFVYYTANLFGIYEFWTGLNDLQSEGNSQWSDGTKVDFVDSSSTGGMNDCYYLFRKAAQCSWGDCFYHINNPCSTTVPAVCKKPSVKRNICEGAHGYFCTPEKCTCYYFSIYESSPARTWEGAKIVCASMGAYLASMHSDEEFKYINTLTKAFSGVWIGLSDEDLDGQFSWVDRSEVDFTNWAANEPSSTSAVRNCVLVKSGIDSKSKWHVEDCNAMNLFVCKRDKSIA